LQIEIKMYSCKISRLVLLRLLSKTMSHLGGFGGTGISCFTSLVVEWQRERQEEAETERKRERKTQRNRVAEGYRNRDIVIDRQRQRDIGADRDRNIQNDRQTDKVAIIQKDR
jgi:hypothetical protein